MKPGKASQTIENPFVKIHNREWQIRDPVSLTRAISPPPASKISSTTSKSQAREEGAATSPNTAAVESGEASVSDHVSFFSSKVLASSRTSAPNIPRLSHSAWLNLYQQSQSSEGAHFVVHQHDHPIAGTHYDLRLQCNSSSSISFAIMYGLPGDPNSRRLNRNATETRVHCLWNHLIETASLSTGSMLIWDTGTYEVLPYREAASSQETDDEDEVPRSEELSQQAKLHASFSQRKIRLRLHGARLPRGYTIALRLTKHNDRAEQPGPPSRKRKRPPPKRQRQQGPQSSGTDSDTPVPTLRKSVSSLRRGESPPSTTRGDDLHGADPGGSDHERSDHEAIRKTNAYPGATNDIGSVHQRKWYLSLDRRSSGFVPGKRPVAGGRRIWTGGGGGGGGAWSRGFARFHVLGRDVERSVVSGRLAREILRDEGVEGFRPRGLWRGVTE